MKLLAKYWQRNPQNGREFDLVEWYLRNDGSVIVITIDCYQCAHTMYWSTVESIGDVFINYVLNNAEEVDVIHKVFMKWLYSDAHEGEYEDRFYELLTRFDLLADLIDVHQGEHEDITDELRGIVWD